MAERLIAELQKKMNEQKKIKRITMSIDPLVELKVFFLNFLLNNFVF